ncbi:putative Methyltransferase domain-containing protein [Seiridium unicorne]|uniref:Methyltransferase domain-containing protein n=1 Tax=Seiridium unicorne TaxID=138068 RepID=A0ABR2UGD4_9PEZI
MTSKPDYLFTRDPPDNNRDKLKDARLVGLGISFDAAPPHETFPANVTLRYWDVKDGVRKDLVGTYDIVHEEADLGTLRFDETKPEWKMECLDELFKLLAIQGARLKPTRANRLPEISPEMAS